MLSNGATVAALEDAGGLRGGTGACGTATGVDDRNVEHAVRYGTPPSSLDDVTPAMAGIQIGAPATETVLALAGPLAMPPAGRRLRL